MSLNIEAVRNEVFRIAELEKYGALVSGIVPAIANGYGSFLVAPDGSKEGWDESANGDLLRDRIVAYLETCRHGDGSTSFDYVEVQFGDDNWETKIVRDSDEARRVGAAAKESK
jgi:hypothetical protein